ncbi:MAG: arginase family protein [Elusimicrobiales bacterium]|nr:arginase family protein [Elusimicrobiales bacterium]
MNKKEPDRSRAAATAFDPGGPSAGGGIFGLPCDESSARLIYLPVPWEATTSYGGGTSGGPAAILRAGAQIDLYDGDVEKPYEAGLFMLPEDPKVRRRARAAKKSARAVISALEAGKPAPARALAAANEAGRFLNDWVYSRTAAILDGGKVPALVGGDHSAPYGAIRAALKRYPDLGVLHFDAHHDLRQAYEGFTWSHASIAFNLLSRLPLSKMVQVGIRDFSEEEAALARGMEGRCEVFYDRDIRRAVFEGRPFAATARAIAAALPRDVWVSFDIDGLDPRLCPSTGTPVPGGLDFAEANYILGEVCRSGRRVIGFDLCEVCPAGEGEWDGNVGARMLYKLSAWTLASRGLARTFDRGRLKK